MIREFVQLFQRYRTCHLQVRGPTCRLLGKNGRLIGFIEQNIVSGGRIELAGWTVAKMISVALDGAEVHRHPSQPRTDVSAQYNLTQTELGFSLDLPLGRGPMRIRVETKNGRFEQELKLPGIGRRLFSEMRLAWRFTKSSLKILPLGIRWLRQRDPRVKHQIRDALELGVAVRAAYFDKQILAEKPQTKVENQQGVTVILPVFNAYELSCEALDRVLQNTDVPLRLFVIDDASTDARVFPALKARIDAAKEDGANVELLFNEKNLGFIASVNRGFEKALAIAPDDPVVLLNSDALVPPGWAGRLLAPLYDDDSIASVTPMSNDAEIASVPTVCARIDLTEGQAEALDARAAALPGGLAAEAPTGVGFCMAMSPRFLAKVPSFDLAFGRGYGEEVDWCRRVAALGGRHVVEPRLFVEHRGGESFGSAEKLRLISAHNAEIARRYPGYDLAVQRFIRSDPLSSPRLVLGLRWLASLGDAVPVYLAHSMGGGADMHLEKSLARLRDEGRGAVILRVGGSLRWQLELETPNGRSAVASDEIEPILKLIEELPKRHVIYSCGVGDEDPTALPDVLLRLAEGQTLEMLFHDYFPLSPSFTLLSSNMGYHGPHPPPDRAHRLRRPNGDEINLAEWRAAWGQVAAKATRLVVFSQASATLVKEVWPEVAARIDVVPHALLHTPPRMLTPDPNQRPVLGVLGGIGAQKGAAVLVELSRRMRDQKGPGLALIGNIDPIFRLARGVPVHGDYRQEDIPALAARYGITAWLIPSIWPETFSFTTHEALAMGLPVLAFDLGAQGDAVRASGNGHPIPLPTHSANSAALAEAVLCTLNAISQRSNSS